MNVIAYDPFLTLERAIEIGVEKVTLEELLRRADFITLHVPKTEQTTGIINANSIVLMKDGVRLINCARGGLIVEADLHAALMSGKVAGAALDVFEAEPAHDNILFGHENVICTPHLGAATSEAQTNVALQIAEQMSDYLTSGAVMNALNMPAISKEDAPRLQPYLKLANQLGLLISQIIEGAVIKISIEYEGTVAELNTKPLSAAALANILRSQLETVNIVNAPALAEARGISLRESHSGNARDWRSVITLYVTTEKRAFQVTGTLFTGREPRLVNIDGVPIEAALCPHMLYIVNVDMTGVIGAVGSLLGQSGQNIADFRLGRKEGENQAVCLVALDDEVPDSVVKALSGLMAIKQVKRLRF
jgi:D-3-phosphoglycerate dehydrogenase